MENKSEKIFDTLPTPKEIKKYLDKYVIGQEEAKKTLSVAVYNHYKRVSANLSDIKISKEFKNVKIDKSNVLLLGDTGTGKTYLLKVIAQMLDVPLYIADATKLTASGYVGDDVESILAGLVNEANWNMQLTEIGIIAIDECDKLARKSDNPSITRDVSGECVQQSLLKIVEDNIVTVPPNGGRKHPLGEVMSIDTTNILFIMMGSFDGLAPIIKSRIDRCPIGFNTNYNNNEIDKKENIYEYVDTQDLISFGIIPELIGRFPIISYTNQLTKDDLKKILIEPKNCIIKQYKKLFDIDNSKINFNNEAIDNIVDATFVLKTGARGLKRIIEKVLRDIMFDYGGTKDNIIEIDGKYVQNILFKNKLIKEVA